MTCHSSNQPNGWGAKASILITLLASFFLLASCSGKPSQGTSQAPVAPHAPGQMTEEGATPEVIPSAIANEDEASLAAKAKAKEEEAKLPLYKVVSETYFPPFVMLDGKGGVVGFESDLLNEIGKLENIRFKYVTHPWKGIFDTIENGTNDIVAASVTINKDRSARYNFSNPYYLSEQTYFSLRPVPDMSKLDNLAKYKVIVKEGTSSDAIVKAHGKQIRYLDSTFTGAKEVINRQADGLVGDSGPLQYYAAVYDKYGTHTQKLPGQPTEFYGFVFSKKRTDDLLQKINRGLDELRKNGKYAELHAKWFNKPAPTLPSLSEVQSGF